MEVVVAPLTYVDPAIARLHLLDIHVYEGIFGCPINLVLKRHLIYGCVELASPIVVGKSRPTSDVCKLR